MTRAVRPTRHAPGDPDDDDTIVVGRAPPPPRSPLASVVAFYWEVERTRAAPPERAMPTATVDLLFNLDEDRFDRVTGALPGAVVAGPYATHFMIDRSRPRRTFGVHCRAGVAKRLFGVSADALADRHVALASLWEPSLVAALRDALARERTFAKRIAIADDVLRHRLAPADSADELIDTALEVFDASPSLARVAAVQDLVGAAARRFVTQFRARVGMTPKRYCRVMRLKLAVERLRHGEAVDWRDVALAAGYSDQAHFVREFRAFTGTTPSRYRPAPGRPLHSSA